MCLWYEQGSVRLDLFFSTQESRTGCEISQFLNGGSLTRWRIIRKILADLSRSQINLLRKSDLAPSSSVGGLCCSPSHLTYRCKNSGSETGRESLRSHSELQVKSSLKCRLSTTLFTAL